MGVLKNELMRTYDIRPSTAETIMKINELINEIAALEFAYGAGVFRGCTGCAHYNKFQTSLICNECSRHYHDQFKEI